MYRNTNIMAQSGHVIGFHEEDFNKNLFSKLLTKISETAKYISHKELSSTSNEGFLIDLSRHTSIQEKRVIGIRRFNINYFEGNGSIEKDIQVAFKVKTKGILSMQAIFGEIEKHGYSKLAKYAKGKSFDTLYNSELKEIACYEVKHPTWKAIQPDIYMTLRDTQRDIYVIAMEDLDSGAFSHRSTIMDPKQWEDSEIKTVLSDIARFHALYYNKCDDVPCEIKDIIGETNISKCYNDPNTKALFKTGISFALDKYPELFDENIANIVRKSLLNMDQICHRLSKCPVTLIHNDFHANNICLRRFPKVNQTRTCVYDWELVRIMAPQLDIVTFLSSIATEDFTNATWDEYVELYRQCLLLELTHLERCDTIKETVKNKAAFKEVFHMCVIEKLWNSTSSTLFIMQFVPNAAHLRVTKSILKYMAGFVDDYPFLSDK